MDSMFGNGGQLDFGSLPTAGLPGIQTASGKPVSISAEALAHARALWQQVDTASSDSFDGKDEDESAVPQQQETRGFVTASGKQVEISDSALYRAKSLWNEVDSYKEPVCDEVAGGFASASGKNAKASTDTGERAQKLWEEAETNEPKASGAAGFVTASGKNVQVSSRALEFAKKLWNEADAEEPRTPPNHVSEGFATANGKHVPVSANALEKARKLWHEVEVDEPKLAATDFSGGFATASGKQVNVSAATLDRARTLWNDECDKLENAEGEELQKTEREEEQEILREDISGPMYASTPVMCDSAQIKRKKPRFVTPFKKVLMAPADQHVKIQQDHLSPFEGAHRTPTLETQISEQISNSMSAPRRFLGARVNRASSVVPKTSTSFREPQKRDRSTFEENGGFNSLSKTPKMLRDVSVSNTPKSVCSDINPSKSCNISITESQEVLESSKALLEDDDEEMVEEVTSPTDEVSSPQPFHMIPHDGKPVAHIQAMVTRVYPVVYACKTADKKIEFYSEASYDTLRSRSEREKEKEVEHLYGQIEAEMRRTKAAKGPRYPLSCLNKDNLEKMNVDELLGIMDSGDDFCDIQLLLSSQKLKELEEAQVKKREEDNRAIRTEVENRLKNLTYGFSSITPVLKIRLMDMSSKCSSDLLSRRAVLSFWRPSEDLCSGFQEGSVYDIASVTLGHSIEDELRFNSMRGTQIKPAIHTLAAERFGRVARKCYTITEILDEQFSPAFNEFDFVGLVVHIANESCENGGQVVYFADESEHFVGLKLWKSIQEEGLDKVLSVGSFLSVINVQWRQSSRKHEIPWGFFQDTTKFATRPKEPDVRICLDQLQELVTDVPFYVDECVARIESVLNGDVVIATPKTPPLARRIQPPVKDEVPQKKLNFS